MPEDILNSLPQDFRLANNLGYLTTFIYREGEVVLPKSGATAKRKLPPGKTVKRKYDELRSQGYKVFIPPQFPHVICAYPDIDLVENFEAEASIDLIKSLILIEENESELTKLDSELKSLTEGVANLELQLLSLDTAVVEREKEAAEIQTRISEFEGKILRVKEEIQKQENLNASLKNNVSASRVGVLGLEPDKRDYPNLSLMLEVPTKGIKLSSDILKPVHEKYAESIDGKPGKPGNLTMRPQQAFSDCRG